MKGGVMYDAETYEHQGVPVRIVYDEDAPNPRKDYDGNLATLVCWHPDYVLGDEQIVDAGGRGAVENASAISGSRIRSMEHLWRYLTLMRKAVMVLPLSLYDHSGITMYVGGKHDYPFDSAGWDTTFVGFAYTTHERVTELCGEEEKYHSEEWIEEQVRAEIKQYDSYLRGECYGFIVADGTEDEESCWGFLGDIDYCKQEANAVAEAIAHDRYVNTEPPDVAEVLAEQ
jgi:hypothetical protein